MASKKVKTLEEAHEDVYDKVYTRCGFMNEERCLKDLTVSLG